MTEKQTPQARKEAADAFEKKWWQSKKFIVYTMMLGLVSTFIICALKWRFDFGWPLATVLVCCVFTIGAVTLSSIAKQAALDAYVRGIGLIGKVPQGTIDKMEKVPKAIADAFDGDE
jgi:hypothetical protein